MNTSQFTIGKANQVNKRASLQICHGKKELQKRMGAIKSTVKITKAMKMVAASKVRKAQAAVISGRPFSDNLIKVLFGINNKLEGENVETPLTKIRPVKSVLLLCVAGSRGLCGGFNRECIKKTVERAEELKKMGVNVKLVVVGRKAVEYFNRRGDQYEVIKTFQSEKAPTLKEATAIADAMFASFVSEDVDKVELTYAKFINMLSNQTVVQTLLPLSAQGEICDIDGNCVDADEDEIFRLTTSKGEVDVKREKVVVETPDFDTALIFEQDPAQILDALLPLYLNSVILRILQETLASELSARMNAMSNATDNATDILQKLNIKYNKIRQAGITTELCEIIGCMVALE